MITQEAATKTWQLVGKPTIFQDVYELVTFYGKQPTSSTVRRPHISRRRAACLLMYRPRPMPFSHVDGERLLLLVGWLAACLLWPYGSWPHPSFVQKLLSGSQRPHHSPFDFLSHAIHAVNVPKDGTCLKYACPQEEEPENTYTVLQNDGTVNPDAMKHARKASDDKRASIGGGSSGGGSGGGSAGGAEKAKQKPAPYEFMTPVQEGGSPGKGE
jgi:uncharacterized membrane protein YgcG